MDPRTVGRQLADQGYKGPQVAEYIVKQGYTLNSHFGCIVRATYLRRGRELSAQVTLEER